MESNPVQSVLSLDKLFFDRVSFSMNETLLQDKSPKYELSFERKVSELQKDQKYRVSLLCKINEDASQLSFEARVVGVFSVLSESCEIRDLLIKKNTLTVLFPYLRSMISLITSQGNIPPIVLPILNIAEMFEDNN